MRIALNGQRILIDQPAGPEWYTINLYKALARTDKINNYIVYLPKHPDKEFTQEVFGNNPRFEYKVVNRSLSWTQIGLTKQLLIDKPAIFFTPVHTVPFFVKHSTKIFSLIHGLEYKTNKQPTTFSIKKLIHPFVLWWVLMTSKKVIVPSMYVKAAVTKYFKLNQNKLYILNEGIDEKFHPRTKQEINPTLEKYGLEYKNYLLMVSTIQPRKNFERLIQAFSQISKSTNLKLVIAGKLGWNFEPILEAPKRFGIENAVNFLKWVPQADLPDLMAGASGYVNFSLDEGFSLTVLEAMATEIPLAISDIPAHRELAEESAFYAQPTDIERIASAISNLTKNKYPKEYLATAREKAKTYTWDKVAQKLISMYSN